MAHSGRATPFLTEYTCWRFLCWRIFSPCPSLAASTTDESRSSCVLWRMSWKPLRCTNPEAVPQVETFGDPMASRPTLTGVDDSTARVNGIRRLGDFLALRRNTSVLLGALVLMGTGEKLWIGFVPKYLEFLGAGVFIIGLFDALQTFL